MTGQPRAERPSPAGLQPAPAPCRAPGPKGQDPVRGSAAPVRENQRHQPERMRVSPATSTARRRRPGSWTWAALRHDLGEPGVGVRAAGTRTAQDGLGDPRACGMKAFQVPVPAHDLQCRGVSGRTWPAAGRRSRRQPQCSVAGSTRRPAPYPSTLPGTCRPPSETGDRIACTAVDAPYARRADANVTVVTRWWHEHVAGSGCGAYRQAAARPPGGGGRADPVIWTRRG
jgi:hypothetical protein